MKIQYPQGSDPQEPGQADGHEPGPTCTPGCHPDLYDGGNTREEPTAPLPGDWKEPSKALGGDPEGWRPVGKEIDLEAAPTADDRKALTTWADAAMFRSEPMPVNDSGRVTPTAYLLNATSDPLGGLAALNAIYTGGVYRSLANVTDEMRREALVEVRKNKLQGPLESIQFHFLLEGVTRSFTHQLVRGRRAFYGQETLRFAVVDGDADDWTLRVAKPPSLEGEVRFPLSRDEELTAEEMALANKRVIWNKAVREAQWAYEDLVNAGVPAEDARGLMPHAMTTRIHWTLNLRELLYVAGVRLCTQAQFEWRTAMASVVKCLRDYGYADVMPSDAWRRPSAQSQRVEIRGDAWQFEAMADLMRPVCYQEGACGFKAKADRSCSIRERVDFRERHSMDRKDSSKWHLPLIADTIVYDPTTGRPEIHTVTSPGIDPAEWLTDPKAAR